MTKPETMRLLLIDVRAFLRNDSMDGVYEKGRREGLLQAIEDVLKPSDEPIAGRSVDGLFTFQHREPGLLPVSPVLGTDKQLTDDELKWAIRVVNQSSIYRALVELWERRGQQPEPRELHIDPPRPSGPDFVHEDGASIELCIWCSWPKPFHLKGCRAVNRGGGAP